MRAFRMASGNCSLSPSGIRRRRGLRAASTEDRLRSARLQTYFLLMLLFAYAALRGHCTSWMPARSGTCAFHPGRYACAETVQTVLPLRDQNVPKRSSYQMIERVTPQHGKTKPYTFKKQNRNYPGFTAAPRICPLCELTAHGGFVHHVASTPSAGCDNL